MGQKAHLLQWPPFPRTRTYSQFNGQKFTFVSSNLESSTKLSSSADEQWVEMWLCGHLVGFEPTMGHSWVLAI